jgi:hypothetical protein
MKRALLRHLGAVPFELVMAGGVVVTLAQHNWKHFAASLFTLLVSFLPLFFERWFRVVLPAWLQITYVAFVFASLFAGEVLHMYSRIWPWDDAMHFTSSLLVGLGVMFWLVMLEHRVKLFHIPIWFGALFILFSAVSVAVLWEIVEFGSDEIFGTFSQGADLFDTMLDLTYQTTSGLIMAVLWIIHNRWGNVPLVSPLIRQFERLNRG